MIPVRMILLQALCLFYLASQGCSQHVIHQREPQQCFTNTEKVARLKCKLFMTENELKGSNLYTSIINLRLCTFSLYCTLNTFFLLESYEHHHTCTGDCHQSVFLNI